MIPAISWLATLPKLEMILLDIKCLPLKAPPPIKHSLFKKNIDIDSNKLSYIVAHLGKWSNLCLPTLYILVSNPPVSALMLSLWRLAWLMLLPVLELLLLCSLLLPGKLLLMVLEGSLCLSLSALEVRGITPLGSTSSIQTFL